MRKLEHFDDVNLSPKIIMEIQDIGKRYHFKFESVEIPTLLLDYCKKWQLN